MDSKKDSDRRLTKQQQEEIQKLLSEKQKWKHFFQIVKRKYVWVPLVLLFIYLKESQPLHIPIIDDLIKILSRMGGFH